MTFSVLDDPFLSPNRMGEIESLNGEAYQPSDADRHPSDRGKRRRLRYQTQNEKKRSDAANITTQQFQRFALSYGVGCRER